MWQKLCSLHLKKTPESVFILQGKFFDYKMKNTDDISSHIQNITEMCMILADLGHIVPDKMIISKIIYNLPPSYNSIIAAWSNVPEMNQTMDNLEERLLRHESLLHRQEGGDHEADHAFFTRSASSSCSQPFSKKEQHQKDLSYLRDLKARTKCYNCHELGHWSVDCPKPKRKRSDSKDPRKIDGGISEANLMESLHISSSSDGDTKSNSDDDFAFMVRSTISSYAFSTDSYTDAWFADSGASEHMTDRIEWFSTFQSIPEGMHTVQTADDTKLWVRGKGNIRINCLVDGKHYEGIMRDVLFVPKLKRNLFSVGLVSKRNLSFVTYPGRCEFNTFSGKKVMEGIRFRKLYQLSITVIQPTQRMTSGIFDSAHLVSEETCIVSTHLVSEEACIVPSTGDPDSGLILSELSHSGCTADLSLIPSSKSNDGDPILLASSSKDDTDLILWHERMGHINIDTIHKMSGNGSLCDFKLDGNIPLQHPCEGCCLGKQHKSSYKHDPGKLRSLVPGQLSHGDVSGRQIKTPSLKGSLYYILYKDDATAFRFVHFAKQKSEALSFFKRVVKMVKQQTRNDVLALRTDQGTEFLNNAFNQFLEDKSISRQTSTVYTP